MQIGFKVHFCNYRPTIAKDLLNYAKAREEHCSPWGVWENLPFKQLSCCIAGVALCLPFSVWRGRSLLCHWFPAVLALAAREIAAAALAPGHRATLRWMLSQFLLGCRWPDWWFLLGRRWTAVLPLGLTRRATSSENLPLNFLSSSSHPSAMTLTSVSEKVLEPHCFKCLY